MRGLATGILAIGAVILYVVTAASQPPEGKDKKDGPPRRGQGEGGPPGGPPPRYQLGQVLPPHARQELKLTKDQEAQMAQLENEVRERLSKILNSEQKKKLENLRPPQPPGAPPGRPPAPPQGDQGGRNPPRKDGPPKCPDGSDEDRPERNDRGVQW